MNSGDKKSIDELFKSTLEEHVPFAYQDKYWNKAQTMISATRNKRKRPLFWWWFTPLFIIGALLTGMLWLGDNNQNLANFAGNSDLRSTEQQAIANSPTPMNNHKKLLTNDNATQKFQEGASSSNPTKAHNTPLNTKKHTQKAFNNTNINKNTNYIADRSIYNTYTTKRNKLKKRKSDALNNTQSNQFEINNTIVPTIETATNAPKFQKNIVDPSKLKPILADDNKVNLANAKADLDEVQKQDSTSNKQNNKPKNAKKQIPKTSYAITAGTQLHSRFGVNNQIKLGTFVELNLVKWVSPRVNIELHTGFSTRSGSIQTRTYSDSIFSFNYSTLQHQLQLIRLLQLNAGFGMRYTLNKKHAIALGVQAQQVIQTWNRTAILNGADNETTLKRGLYSGIKGLGMQTYLTYQYAINANFSIGARYQFGLTDLTNNAWYGNRFDRNNQFQLFGRLNLNK